MTFLMSPPASLPVTSMSSISSSKSVSDPALTTSHSHFFDRSRQNLSKGIGREMSFPLSLVRDLALYPWGLKAKLSIVTWRVCATQESPNNRGRFTLYHGCSPAFSCQIRSFFHGTRCKKKTRERRRTVAKPSAHFRKWLRWLTNLQGTKN